MRQLNTRSLEHAKLLQDQGKTLQTMTVLLALMVHKSGKQPEASQGAAQQAPPRAPRHDVQGLHPANVLRATQTLPAPPFGQSLQPAGMLVREFICLSCMSEICWPQESCLSLLRFRSRILVCLRCSFLSLNPSSNSSV
jgi:hypothetical protein